MGTRSLTRVFDRDGAEIMCMYRQHDGYPEGHGHELSDLLASKQIVNGIRSDADITKIANGIGCLAAQIVAHFKSDSAVGGIYLYPPGTNDCGEEYEYHVKAPAEHDNYGCAIGWPTLVIAECYGDQPKPIFEGKPQEFAAWLEKYKTQRDGEG